MKTAIGFLIFLLIFLSLAACNKKEDLASKIKRLEYEAQKGKSDSQYELGRLYLHGKSIEKDLEKNIFYLEKAAEKNCQMANATLGEFYLQHNSLYENSDLAKQLAVELAAYIRLQ